jgi:hypothetical protein
MLVTEEGITSDPVRLEHPSNAFAAMLVNSSRMRYREDRRLHRPFSMICWIL